MVRFSLAWHDRVHSGDSMIRGGLYSRLNRMNYASFDDIPDEAIQGLKDEEGET